MMFWMNMMKTLDEYLKSVGYRKSDADECIYVKSTRNDDGHISFVILGVYMDDLIPVSNEQNVDMLNSEKEVLCQQFKMDGRGKVSLVIFLECRSNVMDKQRLCQ